MSADDSVRHSAHADDLESAARASLPSERREVPDDIAVARANVYATLAAARAVRALTASLRPAEGRAAADRPNSIVVRERVEAALLDTLVAKLGGEVVHRSNVHIRTFVATATDRVMGIVDDDER